MLEDVDMPDINANPEQILQHRETSGGGGDPTASFGSFK